MGTPRHTLFVLFVTSVWAFAARGEHARGALGSVEASPEPAQSAQGAVVSLSGDVQPRLILPTPGSVRGAASDAANTTATATQPAVALAPGVGTPSKPAAQVTQPAANTGALVGPLSNLAVIDAGKGSGPITDSSDAALGLTAVDPKKVMATPVTVDVGKLNIGFTAPPLTQMPAVGNVPYGVAGGGGGGK